MGAPDRDAALCRKRLYRKGASTYVGRGIRPKAEGENCRLEPLLARLAWLGRKKPRGTGSAGALKPFRVSGDGMRARRNFQLIAAGVFYASPASCSISWTDSR